MPISHLDIYQEAKKKSVKSQKNCRNILLYRKKCVPLHPLSRKILQVRAMPSSLEQCRAQRIFDLEQVKSEARRE